jgi:hypothetical protein
MKGRLAGFFVTSGLLALGCGDSGGGDSSNASNAGAGGAASGAALSIFQGSI